MSRSQYSWRRIQDEPPPPDQDVLFFAEFAGITKFEVGRGPGGNLGALAPLDATHWMFLPEPPTPKGSLEEED